MTQEQLKMPVVRDLRTKALTFLHATLPLPPGINASYKSGRGTFYGSAQLHAFKQEAHFMLFMQKDWFDWMTISDIQKSKNKIPLSISIDFYYATLWRRDIDGGEKAVIDALFDCIGLNDNLIVEKYTRKLVDRERPRCAVSMRLLQEEFL